LFGKPWKKDLCFSEIRLQTSANQSNAIKTNDDFFAIPWETAGGGSLIIVPLSMKGPKLPPKYPTLNAHPSPVSDFQFHPFLPFIASCGRESSVKIWSLPDLDADEVPGLPEEHLILEEHKSKISQLRFHPSVNNLMASGSNDKTIKIWDIEQTNSIFTITDGISEAPCDLQWNLDGSLLACSFQKEKIVRIYDPRQQKATSEFQAHSGVKGTFMYFMENNKILTVGSSKSIGGKPSRNMSVWDIGELSEAAATKPVAENNFSAVMVPYYDPATGLAYLTGRGNAIFYYEINNTGEMIFPIGQSNTSISYTGACPVPKRLCDVKTCELERFYMVSSDTVAITSVICPRKSSQTVFQEDLYPAVPGPQPALFVSDWLDGNNSRPSMISMKPDGLKSVFEVSKEEGGKSKEDEIQRIRSRTSSKSIIDAKTMAQLRKPEITEGPVQVYTNGWLRKWGDRWLELGKDYLYVYESQGSPNLMLCIPLESIQKVDNSTAYDITSGKLFMIESDSLSEVEHFYCRWKK